MGFGIFRRRNRIGNVSIDVKYIELYVIYVTQDQIQSHFRVVEDAYQQQLGWFNSNKI